MNGITRTNRLFTPLLAAVAVLALGACEDVPTVPEQLTPEFARGGGGTRGGPISITTCGTEITQSGKYRLDADLVGCAPNGIVIDASDVTLHLGGHSVGGVGSGVGLDVRPGSANVSIHGPGTLDGFFLGGQYEGVTGSRMSDVTMTHNTFGLAINSDFAETGTARSSGNEFYNNQLLDNAGHGIAMNGGDDNKFRGNLSSGNGGTGFLLFDANGNDLKDNDALGNGGGGFYAVFHSSGNLIQDNRAVGNSLTDLADEGVCDNTWISNAFGTTFDPGCVG